MLLPFTKYTICNNNRNEINHIQIISLIQASMDLIIKNKVYVTGLAEVKYLK